MMIVAILLAASSAFILGFMIGGLRLADPLKLARCRRAEVIHGFADIETACAALGHDEETMRAIGEARERALATIAEEFEAATGVPLAAFERELWGDDPVGDAEWRESGEWREAR